MEQPELMMPLSPLENDEELDISPYWISPSSEKGNQPSSPIEPTGQWNRYLKDVSQQDNCCSLLNPVWRNSPLDKPPTCTGPWSSSIYSAIVTFNVKRIKPEDPPHHPYDVETCEVFERMCWGLAINSRTEQIYITDCLNHVILVFGPDGEYQGQFGNNGPAPGQFFRPSGIAYDAKHDRILVVDKDNHRVQVFSANTKRFLFTFGTRGSGYCEFSYPWGIAVSPNGKHIAVADGRNHRIQLFNYKGKFIRCIVLTSVKPRSDCPDVLDRSFPRGIVFDHSGRYLYVADYNLHRILQWDIFSSAIKTIVNEHYLNKPCGITLDSSGNILVCDKNNHRIGIFRPDGQPVGCLVSIGDGDVDEPLDVTLLPANQIAIMDRSGRVRII